MRIAAVSVLSLLTLAAFGQTLPSFDAASIKPAPPPNPGPGRSMFVGMKSDPGRVMFSYMPLKSIIMNAYGLETSRKIDGAPGWLETDMYDLTGTYPADTAKEQTMLMVQSLLAERCKLAVHRENREQSVFAFTVAPGGSKLKPYDPANRGNGNRASRGHMELHNITLAQLGNFLYGELGRFTIDATGLTGTFDIVLDFTPVGTAVDDSTSNAPSMAKALQEQLGLKLETRKAPIEYLVIDHVEKPTEN
jgi:uncharacterized protein (TIGR03435 family)